MTPPRDADTTRRLILEVAAGEFHRVGFQAASLADIVAQAGVSKGALYHHFENKQALGYAVFDEIFAAQFLAQLTPAIESENPVVGLVEFFRNELANITPEELQAGEPSCNMAQEMSPIDEGFRERADRLFKQIEAGFADAIRRAQQSGALRADLDANAAAFLLLLAAQGFWVQVKFNRDPQYLEKFAQLVHHLFRA